MWIGVLPALVFLLLAITATASDRPSVFLILTSGDPQTQGMALVLTGEALRQGAEVQILLCSEAGKLGLDGHQAPPLKPRDVSPGQMLQKLMQQGAKVEVCALFLPNLGQNAEALLEGIGVAKPQDVTEQLLRNDVRLLTF
jgi:predicted peroxiredoxin